MSVAEFYITKRDNFISFLKTICDEYGHPGFEEIRATKMNEARQETYEDLIKQSLYLRTMSQHQRTDYINTMFVQYGIDMSKVPAESIDKIHRYLDLFSSI